MDQQYFGVSLEKLLTSGGQTLYMVAWSLIIGTIIGIILALILVPVSYTHLTLPTKLEV